LLSERICHYRLLEHSTKKEELPNFEGADGSPVSGDIGKETESKRTYSWFPWRRSHNSASQDHSASSDNVNSSPEMRNSNSPKSGDSPDGNKSKNSPSRTISNHNSNAKNQVLSLTSSSDESEEGVTPESKIRLHRAGTAISMPTIGLNSEKYKKSLRLTSDQIVSH